MNYIFYDWNNTNLFQIKAVCETCMEVWETHYVKIMLHVEIGKYIITIPVHVDMVHYYLCTYPLSIDFFM